jgi:hypothetical protein
MKIKQSQKTFDNFTGILEWCDGIRYMEHKSIIYFKDCKWHREDGPAVVYPGLKIWSINGQFHREDGPAKEWADGEGWWYLKGEIFMKHEWEAAIEKLKKNNERK